MESAPVLVSRSFYFELTNSDHLHEYCLELDKIKNSPHKYNIVDNDIRYDIFGNPFVILQYADNINEEQKIKKLFSYFGEIISIKNLERFDSLTTDHWAGKINMTFIQEYSTKDKENPMHYKIIIYYMNCRGITV